MPPGHFEKVSITRDDETRLSGESRGQEHVIVRVYADRVSQRRRIHDNRVHRDQHQQGLERRTEIRMPVSKVVANASVLVENGGRQDHHKPPRRPCREHVTRRAAEEHAGDNDIRVDDDKLRASLLGRGDL